MQILLIGKGGREHALAWKLNQSPKASHIYVVPGNGGTARGLSKVSNIDDVKEDDYPALVELAKTLGIGLVVVGPDQAVMDGIEGYFRAAGIPCFAPTREAAELEGSKTFAKDFMRKYSIPTAESRNFSNYDMAEAYVHHTVEKLPIVIKASGLAAGKGVIIAATKKEAIKVLKDIMLDKVFGDAGLDVVIEEYLYGDEISVLTFSDGKTTRTLPSGEDHKRIGDGDKGPNTGGMGVVGPVHEITSDVMQEIEEKILKPTFEGLKAEGITYTGMLFTGVMNTTYGPKVLEYNCRFGDPETQFIMLLLNESADLADILLSCTERRLCKGKIGIKTGFAVNVVVAAGGYPEEYRKGDVVEFGEIPDGVTIFHAGTKLVDSQIVTDGGRVLSVAATGKTLEKAIERAYKGVESVKFKDMFYRRDIGLKTINPYARQYDPAETHQWDNELSGLKGCPPQ